MLSPYPTDIELEIRKLNPNKAAACDSLIENVDICAPVLHRALQDFLFQNKLKLADLGLLPKGDEKTNKKN